MDTQKSHKNLLFSLLFSLSLLLTASTAMAFYVPTASTDDTSNQAAIATSRLKAQQEVLAINKSLFIPQTQTEKKRLSSNSANLWPIIAGQFELTGYENQPDVRHQILWYASHKQILEQMLTNAAPYIYYVYRQTQQRNIPAEFALLPMVESGYDPFAYSRAGATGLWQMMPGTASSFGLNIDWWYDARRDTVVSTQSALNYLVTLHSAFKDWLLAAAAYNAGIGAVQAVQQQNQRLHRETSFWDLPFSQETKDYVPKLLALAAIIKHPGKYGITLPYVPDQPYFSAVTLNSQMDVVELGRLAGVSTAVIHRLNPGMRRWASNPNSSYALLLPYDKMSVFTHNLSRVNGKEHVSWQYHEVQTGETLQSIAKNYHTSVALLDQVNTLKSGAVVPEQGLLVPLYLHRTYGEPIAVVHRKKLRLASAKNSRPIGSESLEQLLGKIYHPSNE